MKPVIIILLTSILFSCTPTHEKKQDDMLNRVLEVAVKQIGHQTKIIESSGKVLNPRTFKNNQIYYVQPKDWTSGFFSGTMWYMYKLTGDEKWKELGIKYTEAIDSVRWFTFHHDVGFMINCSFGNAIGLAGLTQYNDVMVDAAKSLSTRFREVPGVIQSWDIDRGWQSERGWMCPVIIDNMMNLELLFKVTKISGDSSFYKIAVKHADNTMKNHYRKDFSCYHVVDYDCLKVHVRKKETAQGYSAESVWSRGQAWGLYGFVVCYRETGDKKYLTMAKNIVNFLMKHPNMPEDLIPYWDLSAPEIPNEPRDASSAAIIASALYELSNYAGDFYRKTADKIMESLASPAYLSIVGNNANFLIMHSVGSIPHKEEIDVPLNYADYYFLEALYRKFNL
jgi:hypothetical protein